MTWTMWVRLPGYLMAGKRDMRIPLFASLTQGEKDAVERVVRAHRVAQLAFEFTQNEEEET